MRPIVGILGAVLGFCPFAFVQDSELIKIKRTCEAIIAANNAGDLNAVAALYAEDAVWLPPTGPAIEGKESILSHYESAFQHFTMKLRLESVETQMFGDWAVDRGFTRGDRVPKEAAAAAIPVNDKYVMILHKGGDGKWRIARLMWSPVYSSMSAAECAELSSSDVAAVRTGNAAYSSAWIANDSAGIMRLFSSDAALMPHHGDAPVEGEAAIRRYFWPPNAPSLQVHTFKMDPAEVAGCGDLAYVRGGFTIEYTTEVDRARNKYVNAGNYLMIFRKHGGRWLISRYIWDDPAPRVVHFQSESK